MSWTDGIFLMTAFNLAVTSILGVAIIVRQYFRPKA